MLGGAGCGGAVLERLSALLSGGGMEEEDCRLLLLTAADEFDERLAEGMRRASRLSYRPWVFYGQGAELMWRWFKHEKYGGGVDYTNILPHWLWALVEGAGLGAFWKCYATRGEAYLALAAALAERGEDGRRS